jgi:hypothetical protein
MDGRGWGGVEGARGPPLPPALRCIHRLLGRARGASWGGSCTCLWLRSYHSSRRSRSCARGRGSEREGMDVMGSWRQLWKGRRQFVRMFACLVPAQQRRRRTTACSPGAPMRTQACRLRARVGEGVGDEGWRAAAALQTYLRPPCAPLALGARRFGGAAEDIAPVSRRRAAQGGPRRMCGEASTVLIRSPKKQIAQ